MNPAILGAVFPVILVGELPDKTMFANLILASRGRSWAVWAGATAAFAVHVAIAVSVGVAMFRLLPHRVTAALVAVLFAGGAAYSYALRDKEDARDVPAQRSAPRALAEAAVVVFLAEWGDLTQVLTANFAARYHDALSVGVGALAALTTVAGIAAIGGARLGRALPVRQVRTLTAVVLAALAIYAAVQAATQS